MLSDYALRANPTYPTYPVWLMSADVGRRRSDQAAGRHPTAPAAPHKTARRKKTRPLLIGFFSYCE
jgi:hypothetical protein